MAVLLMKKGEDPRNVGRRRDVWLVCHTVHLLDAICMDEVRRVELEVGGRSQVGFSKSCGPPMAQLCNRLCKEMAVRERTDFYRAYLDFGVFFMSVEHELSHLVELHDGMNSQVRQVLEELAKDVEGRVETGHGLTDGVAMEKGLGQGFREWVI